MAIEQPMTAAVYEKLGGRNSLGTEVRSESDLVHIVLHRIPLRVLAYVSRRGLLSDAEIDRFIIPARTRRHRQEKKERLTVEESDRLVRFTRIQALAEDVLQDAEKAARWLREPLGELDGRSPFDLAQTEIGARVVEQILAKIDWGAAA